MKALLLIAIAVACLSLVMQAGVANAQTTVSVEQAWNQCLKEVDTTVGAKTNQNDRERSAAFKACMTKLGHGAGN